MNCSHRCDAPHVFKIVTIFIACKQLVLPNPRASWQWDKHSDYLPCGCCAPSTLAHVFTLSLQWYPHSQTKSLMKGSIDRLLCPLTWICVIYMILSSSHNSPYFLRFFLHQNMPILPCTEYNLLFDRFFGTVRVTWSMTQRRSNRPRNSSLGCCVSTSSLDAFSLSMWPETEKERKSGIYIAKDSSLEKLMAVLWS